MLKNKTVTIVGLGLMGGSLGLAIRKKFPHVKVISVSRSTAKLRQAKRLGLTHQGTTNLTQGVKDADWVILCSPVDHILKTLNLIERAVKPGTIVTDVGSVKTPIVKQASKRTFKKMNFVGSHPMVGSHNTGLGAIRADLYKGGVVLVVKETKTDRHALKQVAQFWKQLGMKVTVTSAKQHDEIVANVSHLPHVLSSLLVGRVGSRNTQFASSGFRDVTRLAQGDPS